MRRGQEVRIKTETLSTFIEEMLTNYQKFNNPTVSKFNKATQRVEVKWYGQDAMSFDLDQVEKV